MEVTQDTVEDSGVFSPEQVSAMEKKSEKEAARPDFAPLSASAATGGKREFRKVPVPPHRQKAVKDGWMKIYVPIVENMKLQIRMNLKTKAVEIKSCAKTEDPNALQKAEDFVRAFIMGFEIEDAIALLRLDDLYIDSFEVKDVKNLSGDHLTRAIGRVAGRGGQVKFTIENSTRTRIVLADQRIHILGSFANIKMARDAICDLILGSPPSSVYGRLRGIASRMSERF